MNAVVFTVPGQPVAKGRPRFARHGNFVATYTPEKTANYETLVKWSAKEAMGAAPPFEGALHVQLDIMVQVPMMSKKRMAQALAGVIAAVKRPDMDNIIKGIFDGLLGVVFKDDAQVTRLNCVKRYAATPGVEIRITPLADVTRQEAVNV